MTAKAFISLAKVISSSMEYSNDFKGEFQELIEDANNEIASKS